VLTITRVMWQWSILGIAVSLYVMKRLRDAWAVGNGYKSVYAEDEPWHLPRDAWRIPWIPLRIYMRVADALLFRIWWWTRPAEFWLADKFDLDPVIADWKRREKLNAELARRDSEGIAPDGGRFVPS